MKGIPVGCYRIMNWHLHLEARDLLYPTGWMLEKNLNVVIPVKWIWFYLIRLRISGFIQEVCSIPHLSLSLSLGRKAKNVGICSYVFTDKYDRNYLCPYTPTIFQNLIWSPGESEFIWKRWRSQKSHIFEVSRKNALCFSLHVAILSFWVNT